ncbi:hypothetical protein [Rhizobium sp. BG4]|uniref:rolling circle replication-associated protein n=1 Tax=Rhizobium sp. BG4 TaxID=2613770 RepID=UPI00193D1DD6|nr:hypothetical protein [Rhizobium sp. BG4]QRM46012.1 hypothetical protein F2982_21590 [Rhizobium sp. BG4]
MTLTYGRDEDDNVSHARAAILTYSDVQKFLKRLRKAGFPCRYLFTGEMGSKKGRTHWHGIIFWKKKVPVSMMDYGNNSWSDWKPLDKPVERFMEWDKRIHFPAWPHGFSHWEPVKPGHMRGSIAYACKYIHKDVNDAAAQSKLTMSKDPPLGADYFMRRAERFVHEGISPQDRFYQFPHEAKQKNGTPLRFRLAGKTGEIFCEHFIRTWNERRPGQHWPQSDWLDECMDRRLREESGDYEYQGRGRYVRIPSMLGKEEKTRWQDIGPVPEGRPWRTPLGPTERPPMTRSQREQLRSELDRLDRSKVVWIRSSSTEFRGRWKLAMSRIQRGGDSKPVWMHSLIGKETPLGG